LIDRRWHSSVLDVRSFRGADCDTDHGLVVAKVTVRLAVSKEEEHKYEVQRFHFKNLSKLEVSKQYQIQISYSSVRVGKQLSDMFPIRNGLKQDFLSPLLFNFALKYIIRKVQVNQVA
jgi:hypothetical protein